MLFIPGFMQRGDAWRPVAELLPERYPSRLLDHAEHSFEGRMREIAEAGFVPLDRLPNGTTPATRRRLAEIISGQPPAIEW